MMETIKQETMGLENTKLERVKLQNIVLSQENMDLYFHEKDDELLLDGYFNLLDIAVRKKYTELKGVILAIRAKGYDAISLMHDEKRIAEYKLTDGELTEIKVPYEEYDQGVFWFKLKRRENVLTNQASDIVETIDRNIEDKQRTCSVQGKKEGSDEPEMPCHLSYDVEAAFYGFTAHKHETNICIAMCTFKRETYVKQNLLFIERQVRSDEEVAGYLNMYVVDNGKTLSEDPFFRKMEENCSWLRFIPNKNAGGASGFTRGMLEALRDRNEKGHTRILLMDDDVTIMQDLFVRLYGLLCTLKKEYEDIRIGGELLRKDFPQYLNARGEWSENYLIQNECRLIDLRDRQEATALLSKKRDDQKLYSGWWCACYSLDMVENTNLPLPLFIHDDDISYEREHSNYRIMFLNGISVWHNGFEFGNYGANQYYHIRNKLIASSLYEPEITGTRAAKWIAKCMIALLISYRYKEIELISRAVTDYIRGPEWLYHADAEAINSRVRGAFFSNAMKADDFSEVPEEVQRRIEHYRKTYSVENLRKYSTEDRTGGHLINKLTFNGWILPASQKYKEMTLLSTPFEAYRAKYVILFDPVEEKSVMLKKDYGKFAASLLLILRSVGRIKIYYDRTAKRYREKKPSITTKESWTKYLNL